MSLALCPLSIISTVAIAPAERAAPAGVPLRVRVEAIDASCTVTVRLFGAGGELTARALRYSARSDVLSFRGRAEIALHPSAGVVSFQADDGRSPLCVVVEDWSDRGTPLEAAGVTVVLVRTATGVELQAVDTAEPTARARVA